MSLNTLPESSHLQIIHLNVYVLMSNSGSQAYYMQVRGEILVIEEGKEVSSAHLWELLVRKNPKFPLKYKVFHYFKERG